MTSGMELRRVSVIVPTYNEAGRIWRKLENIYLQKYPRELLEIVVVDSASTDGTVEIVKKWGESRRDVSLKVVEESVRRGKGPALNAALKVASGEIVVITDADALWRDGALRRAVSYFSDGSVGAVSCVKLPARSGVAGVESGYREFYNLVRVGESKAFATPVFHGEFAAFRRDLLEKLGGFDTEVGADDSYTAVRLASMGYRALVVDDVVCVEEVPVGGEYHSWRIRRAQHLIQSFAKGLRHVWKMDRRFKPVFLANAFMHLVNPWLLWVGASLAVVGAFLGSWISAALVAAGAALMFVKAYRSWVFAQFYLSVAAVRNLWNKELVWKKQNK